MTELPERDLAAPDLLGPLLAWRSWRVVQRDGRYVLGSVARQTLWAPRRAFLACCLRAQSPLDLLWWRPPHTAPSASCGCGVYGADLEIAVRYLCDTAAPPAHVIGSVSLWGTVVECEHGFRASHAYPHRLYVPGNAGRGPSEAAAIAADLEAYGVEVELLEIPAGQAGALLARQPV